MRALSAVLEDLGLGLLASRRIEVTVLEVAHRGDVNRFTLLASRSPQR
jgi:hypothetical protein